jgi:hypothetical protein
MLKTIYPSKAIFNNTENNEHYNRSSTANIDTADSRYSTNNQIYEPVRLKRIATMLARPRSTPPAVWMNPDSPRANIVALYVP